MATKNQPGPYDCLAHAEPDEPYFVLLARDAEGGHQALLAWIVARLTAIRDGRKQMADLPQVREAIDCLYAMQQWRLQHSRAGRPAPVLSLPGPADQAYIKHCIETLLGRHSVADRHSDPADDQGYRRRGEPA